MSPGLQETGLQTSQLTSAEMARESAASGVPLTSALSMVSPAYPYTTSPSSSYFCGASQRSSPACSPGGILQSTRLGCPAAPE